MMHHKERSTIGHTSKMSLHTTHHGKVFQYNIVKTNQNTISHTTNDTMDQDGYTRAGNCSNFLVESLTLFHKSDLLEQTQSIHQFEHKADTLIY